MLALTDTINQFLYAETRGDTMSKSKNKAPTLIRQIDQSLRSRLAIGRPKRPDKTDGSFRHYIYSWQTYKSYMRQLGLFARWCKKTHNAKYLKECRKYVAEYLQTRSDLSVWTQKLDLAALQKLYQEYPENGQKPFGVELQPRLRQDIKRSRQQAVRDADFSTTNNTNLITFCKCTGLRRSELQELRGSDLTVDGQYLHITRNTKGGRWRMAPITGTAEEIAMVQRMCKAAGDERVWPHVPSSADIHSYRADYCQRVYLQYARPTEQISSTDKYYCRGDRKGVVLDRAAMLMASRALGHNRIDVIASHYLYNLQ